MCVRTSACTAVISGLQGAGATDNVGAVIEGEVPAVLPCAPLLCHGFVIVRGPRHCRKRAVHQRQPPPSVPGFWAARGSSATRRHRSEPSTAALDEASLLLHCHWLSPMLPKEEAHLSLDSRGENFLEFVYAQRAR